MRKIQSENTLIRDMVIIGSVFFNIVTSRSYERLSSFFFFHTFRIVFTSVLIINKVFTKQHSTLLNNSTDGVWLPCCFMSSLEQPRINPAGYLAGTNWLMLYQMGNIYFIYTLQ